MSSAHTHDRHHHDRDEGPAHVVTLIADPADPILGPAEVAAVIDALFDAGAAHPTPDWLAGGIACDIAFSKLEAAPALAAARAALGAARIDAAALPADGRRKKLLIADMDSTIITCECIDELADFAGLKTQIAEITERAMRGELDFPAALRERVGMLKGLPVAALQRAYDERVRLTPGARTLVQTMRHHGAATWLVSGGFTFFTSRVAAAAGFHVNRANVLIEAGDALAGTVAEPILGAEAKQHSLLAAVEEHGLSHDQTLAVGDGANDIPMIQTAGLGVAFHAKPKTAAAAQVQVNYGDLTALLYLQGYRHGEFVS